MGDSTSRNDAFRSGSSKKRGTGIYIIAVDIEHMALLPIKKAIRKALPECSLSCFDTPGQRLFMRRETGNGLFSTSLQIICVGVHHNAVIYCAFVTICLL